MDREKLKEQQEALMARFDEFAEAMKDFPGVVTLGIGMKVVDGKPTDEMCFTITVKEKRPEGELEAAEMIPGEVAGFPTDVIQEEKKTPISSGRERPLKGGVQVQNDKKKSVGTLGCIAQRNSDQSTVILSNQHVLYSDGAGDGAKIGQPNATESSCGSCSDIIGNNITSINQAGLDCAIASVDSGIGVTNDIVDIGTIVGIAAPVVGEAVRKTGRTTGFTTGTITRIDNPNTATAELVIDATGDFTQFGDSGDSGSVIVNANIEVVGLLYAATCTDPSCTAVMDPIFANDIRNVVAANAMDITIPHPNPTTNSVAAIQALGADPTWGKYKKELSKSVNGRAIVVAGDQYYEEIRDLVHHNRTVKEIWNTNQGPEFSDVYQSAPDKPDEPMPREIKGVKLDTMLNNMADVLIEQGSPDLQAAIKNYRAALLEITHQVDTFNQLKSVVMDGPINSVAISLLWALLWDKGSEFYLPTIVQNGIKVPALGLDIPPFPTIDIGDIPEFTMFKEPVLGYMKIRLTSTKLSGLASIQAGDMETKQLDNGKTSLKMTLNFGELNFSGNYAVSAGGGIGGCAIAAASTILGGGTMTEFVASQVGNEKSEANTDLALWYREPLNDSQNGQDLVGTYYLNKDAIYDLQQEGGGDNLLNQSMRNSNVRGTADDVTKATRYYQKSVDGTSYSSGVDTVDLEDPAPEIGTTEQYASGALPQAYILAMARQKVLEGKDPDGRYDRLVKDIIRFTGQIEYVNKKHPGTHPVGGENGVLDIIANAPRDEVEEFVMNSGPYEVLDVKTGDVAEKLWPEPADHRAVRKAYNEHVMRNADSTDKVDGTFNDRGVNVSLTLDLTLDGNGELEPVVVVNSLQGSIGNLRITLEQSTGWWPGLYNKVANWLANAFVVDILKDHINDALDSQDVRDRFQFLIQGMLKKI